MCFSKILILIFFLFSSSRGVPSYLIGSSHGDDNNSSDNSTEEKLNDDILKIEATPVLDDTSMPEIQMIDGSDLKNKTNNIEQTDQINYDQHENCLQTLKNEEESAEAGMDAIKLCPKMVQIAAINPPPGAPRQENSARLRRYRHNFE